MLASNNANSLVDEDLLLEELKDLIAEQDDVEIELPSVPTHKIEIPVESTTEQASVNTNHPIAEMISE